MIEPPATLGLTAAQRLIWTGQQLHPDSPLYNMVLAFRIDGPVDVEAFRTAFDLLVETTDAMRTVFTEEGGEPRRSVSDVEEAVLEVIDFTGEPHPELAYEQWASTEAGQPFDLSRCAYRSVLVQLGSEEFVWWLSQHHLITDGWAVAVVYERMETLYRDALLGIPGDQPPSYPSFEAYAEYERRFCSSETFSDEQAYWSSKAHASPQAPELYGIGHAPGGTTRSDRITVALGAERSAQLALLTDRDGPSLVGGISQFSFFATVLFSCVARISGQRTLGLLAPAHNRPSARFKATVGLFIEILPIQVDIDRGETFRSLSAKVATEAQDMMVHARPGTSSATHNRAFPILLNFINASFGEFNGWRMRSEWVHPGHGDSDQVLRLQVEDFDGTGEFTLHFDVNRDVLDEASADALVRHFMTLLDAYLEDQDRPLDKVDLRTALERSAHLAFNDTEEAEFTFATVVAAFQRQVDDTPEAVAVSLGKGRITYAELDASSEALARAVLSQTGSRPRVAIQLRRSIEMVVAVWAILKAGGSFVPIDSQYPQERVRVIVGDSHAELAIADESSHEMLNSLGMTAMSVADGIELGRRYDQSPAPTPEPNDLAYVMYTSGSTGDPKGVAVTHANLFNYVWWAAREYGRGHAVSFPLYSSFGFDLTLTSLFVPLVTGGTIVVYREPDGSDLSVRDVFADDCVDVVKLTPSHMVLLESDMFDTRRIRTIVVGGEDLRTTVANAAWTASGGQLEIINEYGPTEATVACMLHRFDPEHDIVRSVPMGQPAANARIHILGEALTPVPDGVVGEIHVSGAGVAMGYVDRPELTQEYFIVDPFSSDAMLYRTGDLARRRADGVVEFMGRADEQVKIRGYRIELGEVETALEGHPSVGICVVDVIETETDRSSISSAVRLCVICGLASNHPDALLNEDDVCKPCVFYEAHRQQADRYFSTMDDFAALFPSDRARNEDGQDCVLLVSGGKDSTYALYQLVRFGLTPLVFTLDNGFISEGAKANIARAVDDLGLELVISTTPAMNAIFAESLRTYSNVCQGCFKTVYNLGMNLAHERGLRHVVTGLSRGQIFETRLADLFRIGITKPDDIDKAILDGRRAYHQVDDEVRRSLETGIFDDDATFESIQVIDFYRYHDVPLAELYAFLDAHAPWVRPTDTGRSTNCLINNTGIYVHKKERRFHNYALPYSWDVRLGHKTRSAALDELNDEIDVFTVKENLARVGYEIEDSASTLPTMHSIEKRLACFYTTADDLSPSEARSYLSSRIPEHMVPSYIIRMDDLPMTINGKIDRNALPDPRHHVASDDDRYVAPRTTNESALADVWEMVMDIERVGIHDAFIELGGDSILNIQIVAEANRRGLNFTPSQLFRHQTIAKLAQAVSADSSADPATTPAPPTNGSDAEPISEVELDEDELAELLRTYGEPG